MFFYTFHSSNCPEKKNCFHLIYNKLIKLQITILESFLKDRVTLEDWSNG